MTKSEIFKAAHKMTKETNTQKQVLVNVFTWHYFKTACKIRKYVKNGKLHIQAYSLHKEKQN